MKSVQLVNATNLRNMSSTKDKKKPGHMWKHAFSFLQIFGCIYKVDKVLLNRYLNFSVESSLHLLIVFHDLRTGESVDRFQPSPGRLLLLLLLSSALGGGREEEIGRGVDVAGVVTVLDVPEGRQDLPPAYEFSHDKNSLWRTTDGSKYFSNTFSNDIGWYLLRVCQTHSFLSDMRVFPIYGKR